MADQTHTRDEKPTRPGLYWVLDEIKVWEGDKKVPRVTDCGYAKWDGAQWNPTEGWKYWYGEAQ